MDAETRARLEAAGHHVFVHPADWLGMDAEERAELDRWEAGDEGPDATLASRAEAEAERKRVARQLQDVRSQVAREVRELRIAAGLTREQVADRAGSTPAKIGHVESGEPGVALELALRAYFAVGGSLERLAGNP